MKTSRTLITALCLIAAPLVPTAQEPVTTGSQPTFRTGTELVTIDVGVVDRQGMPIRGLESTDFTVMVAGAPRRILSAEYVDTSTAPPSLQLKDTDIVPVSTNEGSGLGRLIVFLVDQSSLEPGSVRRVSKAAATFLDQLTFADRSSLWLMPVGPNVGFTWNHTRVREALNRVTGLSSLTPEFEYGSLSDARDIATHSPVALRNIIDRECGQSGGFTNAGGLGTGTQGGGGQAAPPSGGGQTGGEGQQGGTGGTGGPGGTGGQTGGGQTGGGGNQGSGRGFGMSRCNSGIQLEAESLWRQVQMQSMSSLASLRQVLARLSQVRGDKTVVFISGGLPMDEREHMATLTSLAGEAAAARATFFTLFVPSSASSAMRSRMVTRSSMDEQLYRWPLDTMAGMTGGGSFRADVGADATFERLGRELSGYYRLGVEKTAADTNVNAKAQRLSVKVTRPQSTVRARELFDVKTYEDRNWTARLADALTSPVPATTIAVKVTSYVASDPEGSGNLTMMLAGEVSRMRPGKATYQVAIRDINGGELVSTELPLGELTDDHLPFSTNLPVTPGSYIVRLAVMDSAGRVGSVDHRVEARRVPVGTLSASGPLLVRVPTEPTMPSRLTLDGVQQDERLALQVDLEGENERPAETDVTFEIAAAKDGPALMSSPAEVSPGPGNRSMLAQAIADVRVLPPGNYFVRAKVSMGGNPIGELRRRFTVLEPEIGPTAADGTDATVTVLNKADAEAAMNTADVTSGAAPRPAGTAVGRSAGTRPAGAAAVRHTATAVKERAVKSVRSFAVEQVLAPTMVSQYLDQLAARPDVKSPAARELVEHARNAGFGDLVVSDSVTSEAPVAAPFLKGLTLLSQGQLDPAANQFRAAMKAGADFYPAMVYLGACYAAGGQDKEAAGAWRTALIRENDTVGVHLLLSEALMRSGRGDLAMQQLARARERWPQDDGLTRRYMAAAFANGMYAQGLKVVDQLVERKADDEPTLSLALLVLYDAFVTRRPVETAERDRAQMTRLVAAYRDRGGPQLALVETWLAAAEKPRK